MSMSLHTARSAHRALMWGCALVLVAGTGVVGAATASPSVHHYLTPVATGGTFLPTSGKAHTVIIAPDHTIYNAPTAPPPHPDPAFIQQVPGGPCKATNPYEGNYVDPKRYGAGCKRIHFAFGPIQVRPGMNDALLRPTVIEQPRYDGYIVRSLPGRARASDGSVPPVEQLHLHHATWLNLGQSYGSGPFFAAGGGKTSGGFPTRYRSHTGRDD